MTLTLEDKLLFSKWTTHSVYDHVLDKLMHGYRMDLDELIVLRVRDAFDGWPKDDVRDAFEALLIVDRDEAYRYASAFNSFPHTEIDNRKLCTYAFFSQTEALAVGRKSV
jgi:hypothetical protein